MTEIGVAQVRAGVLAKLTGADGPFALTIDNINGIDLPVFVQRPRSLAQLAASVARHGDAEFLVLEDRRLTFTEFADRVEQVAAGLQAAHGIKHGDRVAIFAANRPEWVVTFFAIARIGAIAVAMNGWWTEIEAARAIDSTTPAAIIGDAKRLSRLTSTPSVPVIDFDSEMFGELWNHGSSDHESSLAEDDPALILFTSGTTGAPKGALISHRGMIGFSQSMMLGATLRAVTEMTLANTPPPSAPPPPGITLGNAPLFHVSGLFGHVLMSMTTGAKVVYYRGRFEPEKILNLIEKERITAFSPIGATGSRLINHPRFSEFDTTSVARIGLGGAPTSPAMQAALMTAFPSAQGGLGGGYGSSESTAVVSSQGADEFAAGPERAGMAHPDVEVEIRDDTGNTLPPGEQGNIWCRSAYTMLGYWQDAEATAEVIDDHGWLSMGDVGWIDGDGYITINSRARDMILRSAENIYPGEIENRLQEHPAVGEVAVVGVDHDEHGQVAKAVIVPASASDRSGSVAEINETQVIEELRTWCAEALSAHKVPEHWELRTEPLPRNAAGKVLKRDL